MNRLYEFDGLLGGLEGLFYFAATTGVVVTFGAFLIGFDASLIGTGLALTGYEALALAFPLTGYDALAMTGFVWACFLLGFLLITFADTEASISAAIF